MARSSRSTKGREKLSVRFMAETDTRRQVSVPDTLHSRLIMGVEQLRFLYLGWQSISP